MPSLLPHSEGCPLGKKTYTETMIFFQSSVPPALEVLFKTLNMRITENLLIYSHSWSSLDRQDYKNTKVRLYHVWVSSKLKNVPHKTVLHSYFTFRHQHQTHIMFPLVHHWPTSSWFFGSTSAHTWNNNGTISRTNFCRWRGLEKIQVCCVASLSLVPHTTGAKLPAITR